MNQSNFDFILSKRRPKPQKPSKGKPPKSPSPKHVTPPPSYTPQEEMPLPKPIQLEVSGQQRGKY